MSYADYAYYTDSYGGKAIKQEDFHRLAVEASCYLDLVTSGRAEEHSGDERLMMCCCALCDILAATADTGGMVKQSESVGSWSYTLASGSSTSAGGLMFSKCQTWLPADWLYRGVARE
ncbi:MAG: hypothetical protein EGR45_03630 [Ruminococcaceae bacterium]|nr:hypothetical protein [Oscillospiraceae bacterium]